MIDTYIVIPKLYGIVSKAIETRDSQFRANVAKFVNDRHEQLFDIAPYDRIYFNQKDIDLMFKSLNLDEKEILNIIQNTCYYTESGYNPPCAREPYVMVLLMIIRYYLKTNKRKYAELTAIYLAFSGKFYASIHAGKAFPTAPPSSNRAAMDYVINNMLTEKFDLKKEGSVFGAIKSICITWIDTYQKGDNKNKWSLLDDKSSDDDLGKIIQQLRERERSFLMNIAKLYYEAIENKLYLNYETDNYDIDKGPYRITDNDSVMAARITENTVNYMVSNYVSLQVCNQCKDNNVKALEIKDIIETILADKNNLPDIRKVINILIVDFMGNNPGKKIGSVEFVSYTIKAKPNSKDQYLNQMKSIILKWLDENSPNYRKRKSRKATAISYYRSILMYFVLIINKIARNS